MPNVLITGISGFVGPFLKKVLEGRYNVHGIDQKTANDKNVYQVDLLDIKSLEDIVKKINPVQIYHLAGFSSVKESFDNPQLVYDINVTGTEHLFNVAMKLRIKPKVLLVSSAEVYGKPNHLPITEQHSLAPLNPYGESRVNQEKLLKSFNLPVCIARSFNHSGPGQSPAFVLSSFGKQIAEIEKKIIKPIMYVGNLEAKRDFSDVRDVVNAYSLIMKKGKVGEVYNVCSGEAYTVSDLLKKMLSMSKSEIVVEKDSKRMRPSDIPILQGDRSKLEKDTGSVFRISIDKMLKDILDFWRDRTI
ncbi:GDP-mannose 4,6-dehydratase [Patescibacteria group bacterium]|nr:GDP-mannose 4,6-dehydratase [Patescibacteria group bacterium]MBU1074994.1 GDP-mannose 4,6-dehydratase [Patescibacteria group bacterium]MBU1951834.1 GDP-mannose 4,6-dehydratase [Patescibacteria group bacterium]MBU2228789.1 GDP-mannose 4,6-dehydratase [Patescibacteria group bacterium]MBU2235747.1 GDP-mannose 4,6-dehydratase [Patescibacteria group bacterium]